MGDVLHMLAPAIFGVLCRLNRLDAALLEVLDTVREPVDVLLYRDHHVAQHGRAARSGDREQVREAGHGDAEVGAWTFRPLLPETDTVPAADVDLRQRAGHGVVAGGEDDAVQIVHSGFRAQSGRCDLKDRVRAKVYQRHILTVIGLVVVRINAQPLGPDRVTGGQQRLGGLRIVDGLANLVAHELGGGIVGFLAGVEIAERGQEMQTAALPAGLVGALAIFRRDREDRNVAHRHIVATA